VAITDKYILNAAGEPVPCPSAMEWGKWFQENRMACRVARTKIGPWITVSTVFLGLDHAWRIGPPILWETLILGADGDEQDHERYSTRKQALAGHKRWVRRYRLKLKPYAG
jgi:hypothetical protein